MLRYVLFFTLIITIFFSCSNRTLLGTVKSATKEKVKHDPLTYYRIINQAELFICDEKFQKALDEYINAFSYSKKPFGVDIWNALTCSVLAKQYEESAKLAERLILLGCKRSFFYKRKLYSDFLQSEHWQTVLMKFDSLYTIHQNTIEPHLIYELDQINRDDQKYRIKNDIDSTFYTDNLNKVRLDRVLNYYGYPSERKTGVTIAEDTLIISNWITTTFRHYFQNGNTFLLDTLKHFVREGELQPEQLSTWVSTRPKYPVGDRAFVTIDGIIHRFTFAGLAERIAKNRKLFYLSPHEDYIKKGIFQNCNPLGSQFSLEIEVYPTLFNRSAMPKDAFDIALEPIDCK